MTDVSPAAISGPAVLSLRFQVLDDRPDWPVVHVLVDGTEPFADVAPDWRGFDPGSLLGPRSPLLPDEAGRRVAIYRCSCGEPGCGVIAPMIVPSPDGRRISWVDFRNYTAVFTDPADSVAGRRGRPWDLPDIHFDREQYVAEVERASQDSSWETTRRRTARLLHERLRPQNLVLPPDLGLAWASPAWNQSGITLVFRYASKKPRFEYREELLRLLSDREDPADAAADMAEQLLATPPEQWVRTFGGQPS